MSANKSLPVSKMWYDSAVYQAAHRMVIYTPPSYESSTARYPVLYLLHGGGSDETSRSEQARATQIFDNLIAQGKMVPSIVVMPNALGESASQAVGENGRATFLASLIQEIIPFVDKTYRTKADANDRAVAGQSGGGGETILSFMNNLDKFGWAGAFSPGWPDVPKGFLASISKPADADLRRGPEVGRSINSAVFESLVPKLGPDVNSHLHLFYFGVGDADGLVETEQAIAKVFDQKGVKYQWVENGKTPEQILQSYPADGKTRTRPLCAYPKSPQYKGTGDTDKAENFVCAESKLAKRM